MIKYNINKTKGGFKKNKILLKKKNYAIPYIFIKRLIKEIIFK